MTSNQSTPFKPKYITRSRKNSTITQNSNIEQPVEPKPNTKPVSKKSPSKNLKNKKPNATKSNKKEKCRQNVKNNKSPNKSRSKSPNKHKKCSDKDQKRNFYNLRNKKSPERTFDSKINSNKSNNITTNSPLSIMEYKQTNPYNIFLPNTNIPNSISKSSIFDRDYSKKEEICYPPLMGPARFQNYIDDQNSKKFNQNYPSDIQSKSSSKFKSTNIPSSQNNVTYLDQMWNQYDDGFETSSWESKRPSHTWVNAKSQSDVNWLRPDCKFKNISSVGGSSSRSNSYSSNSSNNLNNNFLKPKKRFPGPNKISVAKLVTNDSDEMPEDDIVPESIFNFPKKEIKRRKGRNRENDTFADYAASPQGEHLPLPPYKWMGD